MIECPLESNHNVPTEKDCWACEWQREIEFLKEALKMAYEDLDFYMNKVDQLEDEMYNSEGVV